MLKNKLARDTHIFHETLNLKHQIFQITIKRTFVSNWDHYCKLNSWILLNFLHQSSFKKIIYELLKNMFCWKYYMHLNYVRNISKHNWSSRFVTDTKLQSVTVKNARCNFPMFSRAIINGGYMCCEVRKGSSLGYIAFRLGCLVAKGRVHLHSWMQLGCELRRKASAIYLPRFIRRRMSLEGIRILESVAWSMKHVCQRSTYVHGS